MDAVKAGDKFETLLQDSSFALALLANEQTGDWALVEPQPVQDAAKARTYSERNLSFAGILGIVGDKPRSALAMPLEGETITAIVAEFIQRYRRTKTHPRWTMRPVLTAN